jgi:hypothetical protein
MKKGETTSFLTLVRCWQEFWNPSSKKQPKSPRDLSSVQTAQMLARATLNSKSVAKSTKQLPELLVDHITVSSQRADSHLFASVPQRSDSVIFLAVDREVRPTRPTFHRTIEKHGVARAGHHV